MQIDFAKGTSHQDLEDLGINPEKALACVLAHNSGRDVFEAFCESRWGMGDFGRVEAWANKLYSSPFNPAGWHQTLLLVMLADLFDEGGAQSLDGCTTTCPDTGFEYLEAGDTYNGTITLDDEGVLRVESWGDMIERLDRERSEEPVTYTEFEEAYERMSPLDAFIVPGVEALVREFYNNEIIENAKEHR